MSDNDERKLKDSELFFGEATKGIPWEEFDQLVYTWGLKKYGRKISVMFWEDTFPDFGVLNMLDPVQRVEWELHCTMIYDNMAETNFKMSESLFKSPRFWTQDYQDGCKERQFEKCYVNLKELRK